MADKQAVTELLNRAGVAYDIADTDFLTKSWWMPWSALRSSVTIRLRSLRP